MVVTPGLLSVFPILKPLPHAVLSHLAGYCSIKKFSRRSIVLNAGKREDFVCFLFEGRLQGVDFTIDGREVGLYFIEPGDFCGDLALFGDEPQAEFVIALTSTVTVFVPVRELREVVHKVPLDRLLIETDSPYLAPVPNRGKRNEPAFVKDTAKYLANLKEISLEHLVSTTTKNFLNLFHKAKLSI